MSIPIRVLILEDRTADAELMLHELRQAGFDPHCQRVDNKPDYVATIETNPDLILADWSLPQFNGLQALQLKNERGQDIPFIIVSGSIGEEEAVQAMREGADDYILKDRLARLGETVRRALEDKKLREERKQAEEALRSKQRMLARTEGIAHIGSWEWNIAADKVTWSDEMFRIFQRDLREGAPSFSEHPAFYHPEDMARLRQAVEAAITDGTPYELELRAIRKDGETRVCVARGIPEMDPGGRAVSLFGSLQDITERKQAEQKLLEYSEHLEELVSERTRELRETQEQLVRKEKLAVLGQLAGGVAHEMRNPLGVIKNAIYYLKLVQPEANNKVRKYHTMIEQEVHTSEKIINEMLDFTRVIFADREPLSVPELMQRVLERHPTPPSMEVAHKLSADLPKVYADPRQMEQVLGNLVVNAYQAMSHGGKLTIATHRRKEMVAIAVKDNGVGIPPENMSKLFTPLFTTKITGIGLGLAISKRLAEANGGWIEVQSAPGKGSTFTVYLPTQKG